MIKLSLEEKMLFVKSYINNEIDLNIINAEPNKKFEETILAEFEYLLELSKIEAITSWHKSLNNENIIVEDLKERIIETQSGKILIGIRHLGMDISNPFVNVWSSFPIEKELETIKEIAKNEFKVFKPKFIRFWVKPNSNLSIKNNNSKGNSYYINTIENIIKKDFPDNYKLIRLEKINNLSFYEWYKDLYYQFHIEMNDLEFLVRPNSKEDFEQSIKDNLISHIIYKNEIIGLIAAISGNFIGENSIYVTEIILKKKYKGNRLASAAQRKFIEEYTKNYKYIWGKISSKNPPSYKNALRVGRKIISSEVFIYF